MLTQLPAQGAMLISRIETALARSSISGSTACLDAFATLRCAPLTGYNWTLPYWP